MAYDFKKLRTGVSETEGWLEKEYFGIRTGRATPALLDGVQADVYGSRLSLRELAALSVEDARTLRITPYDVSQSKEIERAIVIANLGVSVAVDEKGLRVSFPELTSERRAQLSKLVNQKLEEARISLRKIRDSVWDDIQERAKRKEIGEDDKFRFKDEMQKLVDDGGKRLEALAEKKRRELES